MDNVSRKFGELDDKLETLGMQLHDIDTDTTAKLSQMKNEVHKDYMRLQSTLTDKQKSLLSDSQRYTNDVRRELNGNVQALSDRVCVVEGQSARLAAVEDTVQQSIHHLTIVSAQAQPIPSIESIQVHPVPVPSMLTSTIQSGGISACDDVFQANNSNIPLINSYGSNNVSRLSNTSGITLDYTQIPNYNGNLIPIHPEEFLDKVNQYFSIHPVPDDLKISLISEKFVNRAHLWFTT